MEVLLPSTASASLALVLFLPSPLWAIPSPDLVINLFASAAQVFGLLTVVCGGLAYSNRRRRLAAARPGGKGLRWAFRASLVLLLLSLSGNLFQYFHFVDRQNLRLQTNLTRSSTEGGKKIVDVDLKELPYSEQLEHAAGVPTEEVGRWLAEGRAIHFIDVREPEEVEMGRIATSTTIRYPDIRRDPSSLVVEGKQTILLCFNGNRSSELVNEFAKEGYSCRFMVGGYEKWIAEDRPLDLARARIPGEIRDIQDYPNKGVLLDTPEVLDLVEKENALFVDVRYPGEFEKDGLPGAINVTMRKLPTDQLWAELKKLPKRPIIAACYDKRSSFFGLILGLRLHRLGHDYRGRYTVPQEFAVSKSEKAYVAAWKEAQAEKTLLGLVAAPLGAALTKLSGSLGSFALAIALLVLVLRLLVAPFTMKGERDAFVLRALAPRIKALKEKLADDPQRLSRALRALHRQHGLAHGRNLIGTALQILLFLVFFSVVNRTAAGSEEAFLWIEKLGNADPLYVLPTLVSGLIFIYLDLVSTRRGMKAFLLHALVGGLLFLLTFTLRAAVNLYLAFNIFLLIIQSLAVRRFLRRRQAEGGVPAAALAPARDASRKSPAQGVCSLRRAHLVPGTGNKARRLAIIAERGFPVPDGFVITDEILRRRGPDGVASGNAVSRLAPHHRRLIERAWKKLGVGRVAVRSSGLNEDGTSRSYAGVFESMLNVEHNELFQAIAAVHGSLASHRANAYGGGTEEGGGILVQEMVDADYAGVLFTEHPETAGACLVELVAGLGDALVSGSSTPESYRFGRLSGRPLDERQPPIDLEALLDLGRRLEALFGTPQDIEWAYVRGRFLVLQTRDITTLARAISGSLRGATEADRANLLAVAAASGARPDDTVFAQNELSELLPRPTPLSLSFMERLWAPGGTTDLACRALGIRYNVEEEGPPYVNCAFGCLYVNRLEEKKRLGKGPGPLAAFRLSRSANDLVERFRRDFLPRFQKEIRLREAVDFSRLSFSELLPLLEEWTRHFVTETYVEGEIINVAADFHFKTAAAHLRRKGLDPAAHLGGSGATVVHQAMSILPAITRGERPLEDFLEVFGHRAPLDYELSQPRYRESLELMEELLRRAGNSPTAPAGEQPAAEHPEIARDPLLALAVERARTFQVLKEEAKHHCLREAAALRTLLLEIDRRLELKGGIFFLTLDEVQRLRDGAFLDKALDLIDRRSAARAAWKSLRLPGELSLWDLEALELDGAILTPREPGADLRGTRVSGDKEVVGRIRVIHEAKEIDSFLAGEILVARYTDPAWMPLFPRAAGVITEVGGWLSHAAIVAREYRIPAIVGASGALDVLHTGELVRLRTDGTVQKVATDRRRHERVSTAARVAILRQGEIIEALLRNLSASGALIEVAEDLREGQGVHIRISSNSEEIRAEVVRRDVSGGYALRFSTPLAEPLPVTSGPGKN